MNWYFVYYNGDYVATYKSIKGCLNYIDRKGYQDDYDNRLFIVDKYGDIYSPINGRKINF